MPNHNFTTANSDDYGSSESNCNLAAGNLAAPLQICDPDVVVMPPFPATLRHLNVLGCTALRTLGRLPATLTALYCSDCPALEVLPRLPATFRHLICRRCQLLTTLGKLPATLELLYCMGCTALVATPVLPATMTGLYCNRLALGLPDAYPAGLMFFSGAEVEEVSRAAWCQDVAVRHREDRRRVAAALPPAALLYV